MNDLLPRPYAKPTICTLSSQSHATLENLVASSLILAEDLDALPLSQRNELGAITNFEDLLDRLVERGLITEYQSGRLAAGTIFGLILGNYRVLDRLVPAAWAWSFVQNTFKCASR